MKEVYVAKGVDGEILYVGQGNRGRNVHCFSGCSHNKRLNRYYFQNGEGGCITTEVLHECETLEEALMVEEVKIKELNPLFNRVKNPNKQGYNENFRDIAKEYYELSLATPTKESLTTMEDILSSNEYLKIYVETIGIKAIRAAGFHKTKCKVKYEKEVGIHKGVVEKLTALRSIKLKQNNFYSFKELKDLVKCAYDKLNVTCAAKATDIQSVYSVKSTSRNGVRGYLIIGKI